MYPFIVRGDWLYWGVLGAGSSLLLDGGIVCSVPEVQ